MKGLYFESVVMIERLHRLFLEVVRIELDRMNIRDINNVQCLVLYNIGREEVTVGELTNRGYYLGSNVSYNLRKMVQNQYLIQKPSPHDRRSSHVKLSPKGLDLHTRLDELFDMHAKFLIRDGLSEASGKDFTDTLRKLESFWSMVLSKDLRKLG